MSSPKKEEDGKYEEKSSSSLINATLGRITKKRRSRRIRERIQMQTGVKQFDEKMEKFISETPAINVAVAESTSISKMMAATCFALGEDVKACCHLIASHGICMRNHVMHRTQDLNLRQEMFSEPLVKILSTKDLDGDLFDPATIVSTLEKMPTEWYVVQITAEHEHLKDIRHRLQPEKKEYSLKPTHGLYIMALPTGENAKSPVCVTVPKPSTDELGRDIRIEIESLLNSYGSDLTKNLKDLPKYWKMRRRYDEQMSAAISDLEFSWLKEWRVLLMADYLECLDMVEDIHDMIDKLIADSLIKKFPLRTRWLLKKIACGACHLQPCEIERAVKKILPTQPKLAKNIILYVVAKAKDMEPLKTAKRKTLVLILDECLDHIPFESSKMLKHQPVTRLPSLHVAYALFKQHESTIKNGHKIVKKKSKNLGTFIVNPSSNLPQCENRMKSFIQYWLPKWTGLYGTKPDLQFFKNALKLSNILLYSGHGNGTQFLNHKNIERMRVQASVFLFGCRSAQISPAGGRLPGYGVSYEYLMACSPCILGMLWVVTDGDIDLMSTKFMSVWASSRYKRTWSNVNPSTWFDGAIEFHGPVRKVKTEPDMLVAVAKSKDMCEHYMNSAAVVVRGLPVKLVD